MRVLTVSLVESPHLLELPVELATLIVDEDHRLSTYRKLHI